MRYILLLITLPMTVFAVAFVVSNPQAATVSLFSFGEAVSIPLGVIGLVMMGSGFFFGALFVWLHSQSVRFRCWRETRRANRLEKELAELQTQDMPTV